MKTIKEHIKNNEFNRAYLIYGTEAYLKKIYMNKLKAAIIQDTDDMNYSYFEGKASWLKDMISIADTLPFFADRRLIIIENSGLFKEQNELADVIRNIPDTTIILFVENEIDKRSKLFKAVKDIGYICEINTLNPIELKQFVIRELNKEHKSISDSDAAALIELIGTDMMLITNELHKLTSYCATKDRITLADCENICTVTLSSHIFKMIDLIAQKKQKEAIVLYNELLKLKQAPLSILYNINKHFNNLYLIAALRSENRTEQEIISKTGILPWKIRDYNYQLRTLGMKRLKAAVEYGADMDERIKTGRMDDQMAVEMVIIKLSA